MANKLFISNDLDFAYGKIREEIESKQVITYDDDEFKVEQARELIGHGYIASESEKYIIVKAKRYNEVSQNALLKILEEPPKNVNIYLIGLTKAIFLPTIRSRLSVEKISAPKEEVAVDFDFSNVTLSSIYEFGKKNGRFMDKELARAYINKLFERYKKEKNLDEKVLDFFAQSYRLISLNGNPQSVIITLMMFLNDKKTSPLH